MNIRYKLTTGFIAVVLLANTTLCVVTVVHINHVLLKEVQNRVRLDLNSARRVYDDQIDRITQFLLAVSLDQSVAFAVAQDDMKALFDLLQTIHLAGRMDKISFVKPDGKVFVRAGETMEGGYDVSINAIIAEALREQKVVSGTCLIPHDVLAKYSAALAERAYFILEDTPAARPAKEKTRSDGMVMGAAIPIWGSNKEFLGLLYGANLLNRRYELVDKIKGEVFQNLVYGGKDIGTATIFQGDLRISTNVKKKDGTRAIGTRLSSEVVEQVLEKGLIWEKRAFVVDEWYITAYEPIRDPGGRIIGALYVGLLETPFIRPQHLIISVFLFVAITTTVLSLLLLYLVIKYMLQPIVPIIEMSRKVIEGDLSARVVIRPPGEMGLLCRAIDHMAEAVARREQQLHEATRRQIGQSEKLASVGRLAAGIAHEINNPLTGVLTFSHLLKQNQHMTDRDKEDLDVIIRETTRVRQIVRGLLEFARETPSRKEIVSINEVIRNTITLLRSQEGISRMTIVEDLAENLPPVFGDKNQLQQVILNLSLNGCEAMRQGGTLTIGSSTRDKNVVISVADTGCGIKGENLGKIFDPFYTTKPVGKGTGLGLSVSYGIVQQHGGSLEVDSEEGEGSVFTVVLPMEPEDLAH